MYKITLLLFFCLTFVSQSFAQHFEGIIQMHQETANGIHYDVTWYIKQDKIAFEISSPSARGNNSIRFVPQIKSSSILMITGDTKKEIPLKDITSEYSFDNIQTKLVEGKTHTDFKQSKHYEISTNDVVAEVEISEDIDINFAQYAAFFKNDCGLYVLANSKKVGFPINSTAKDKSGKLISKTTFKSMQRTKVDDAVFN